VKANRRRRRLRKEAFMLQIKKQIKNTISDVLTYSKISALEKNESSKVAKASLNG
jgi:uncharacterized sporulation protein YeaH/YhbH (DUF444 family)